MKTTLLLSLLVLVNAQGSGVSTKTINPQIVTEIVLSQDSATAILFPSRFSMVIAKGLVFQDKGGTSKKDPEVTMGGYFSPNNPVLCLYAKVPELNTSMSVYMDGQLYPFNLRTGPDADTTLTLVVGDGGTTAAQPSKEVTPQQVINARPKFSDALLVSLKNRAQGALLRQKVDPQGYRGYQHRSCLYVSEDERVKTTVTDLHRFPIEDAVVIEGTIQNLGSEPIKSGELKVAIGNPAAAKRAVTFSNWTKPIAPHATASVVVELVGDESGEQIGMSIWDNEFRLIVEPK